ncbi:MAG: ABC-type transport system involved in cytochrome c biogenesis permease subunit, partial [Verrucomicrobiales bacterium]
QAEQNGEVPPAPPGALDALILILGQRANQYDYLAATVSYAKAGNLINGEAVLPPDVITVAAVSPMSALIGLAEQATVEEMLQSMRTQQPDPSNPRAMVNYYSRILFLFHSNAGKSFQLFPPQATEVEEWISPGGLIEFGVASESESEDRAWAVERVVKLEALASAAAGADNDKILAALTDLSKLINAGAEPRGETRAISAEVLLNKTNPTLWAFIFIILAFLVITFSWLSPGSKASRTLCWIAIALAGISFAFLVFTITLRSYIRLRPPITNLYDTFIFIAATAIIAATLIELMTRRLIVISAGIVLSGLCLFFSGKYLEINPGDSMEKLEAVLRTNYYLAIHVQMITFGYMGGLLAAVMAHAGIVMRFWMGKNSKDVKDFTRITFGVVCFSLTFSLVGTIWGGVWANDSWGRFWGWDPKENGALMIVLWTLVILHMRWGGYVRETGINALTLGLGCIVTFSWFGVNAMGVGLHSYGFSAGIMTALTVFWIIEGFLIMMAIAVSIEDKVERSEAVSNGQAELKKSSSGAPRALERQGLLLLVLASVCILGTVGKLIMQVQSGELGFVASFGHVLLFILGIAVFALSFFLMLFGAISMLNGKSYRMSWVGAIAACVSILGLPLGIWAITKLKDEKVKASFA